MIGSFLYCIALLATAEIPVTQNNASPSAATIITETPSAQLAHTPSQLISVENTVLEKIPQPIILTNKIVPDMLQYKHWTGTYSPKDFDLYINDTKVSFGETYTLKDPTQPFTVHFDYCFSVMRTIRKGTKKFFYQMKEQCSTATLTFSWLDQWKVLIDNATPLKEIV